MRLTENHFPDVGKMVAILYVLLIMGCSGTSELKNKVALFEQRLSAGIYKPDFRTAVAEIRALKESTSLNARQADAWQKWNKAVTSELELLDQGRGVNVRVSEYNFNLLPTTRALKESL